MDLYHPNKPNQKSGPLLCERKGKMNGRQTKVAGTVSLEQDSKFCLVFHIPSNTWGHIIQFKVGGHIRTRTQLILG